MDDIELLLTFAERGSEDAFRTLVDRHINLVYSVARQTVRDPQLAEEIVQTVFIILAQKATRLGQVKALSGWLYRTTRLAAIQAVRNECRRREREEKFAQMDRTPSESVWEQVEPHLGEVMDRLSELDRNILALRFFESKSFKEVALVLGKGEDAARMRVNRHNQPCFLCSSTELRSLGEHKKAFFHSAFCNLQSTNCFTGTRRPDRPPARSNIPFSRRQGS